LEKKGRRQGRLKLREKKGLTHERGVEKGDKKLPRHHPLHSKKEKKGNQPAFEGNRGDLAFGKLGKKKKEKKKKKKQKATE